MGSHHRVIDNLLPGNYAEDAIDVATEDSATGPAAQDIKIIGSRIYGARLTGGVIQHQCRHAWVLGNTIMDCGMAGAKSLSLGKDKGDGLVKASGNLLIDNPRSVRLRDRAEFRSNTIIHRDAGPIIEVHGNADHLVVEQNLVIASQTPWLEVRPDLPALDRVQIDGNWYQNLSGNPGEVEDAFRFKEANALAAWQKLLGQDAHSQLGGVPGLDLASAVPADPQSWDARFFARFVPAKSWPGYTGAKGGVGAFGPDGKRQGLAITPFAGYQDNDGYGWPGTELVRQRYPLLKPAR